MPDVGAALRAQVSYRAKRRCEYCLVPESLTLVNHEVDHIVATKHGGRTSEENLALSCTLCNRFKGTDLASADAESGEMHRLFDPRRDSWNQHFELREGEILARTAAGRVTMRLLQFNRQERIRERKLMIQVGGLSPECPGHPAR